MKETHNQPPERSPRDWPGIVAVGLFVANVLVVVFVVVVLAAGRKSPSNLGQAALVFLFVLLISGAITLLGILTGLVGIFLRKRRGDAATVSVVGSVLHGAVLLVFAVMLLVAATLWPRPGPTLPTPGPRPPSTPAPP